MASVVEESGESGEPGELRQGWRIAGFAVRIVLLSMLLFGGLVVALSMSPSPRTLPEFRAALSAGRVRTVDYQASTGQGAEEVYRLVWSERPLVWHRIEQLPIEDGERSYTVEQLWRDTAGTGADVLRRTATPSGRTLRWPFDLPPRLGLWWVGAAWGLTFLIMLGSTPRLGNRWAWLWMFTGGQIGAIMFLLFEPRPLWYRRGQLPPPRRRLGGGLGFLASIPLAFLAGLIAMAVGVLSGELMG